MNKVTCVKFSPDGNYIASGDDKGKVRIWSFNEETKEVVVRKEHSMLGGAVTSISWTDDGQRICAAGEGKDMFAKAVLVDSGSKVGDLFGPSKNVIAMDMRKKPYRLVMGGENLEMYVFDGVPFKHAKTLHTHQNFVNRILFRPDGKQFASVSSDKNVVIHDSETLEPITTIEKAHTKGVMDIAWLGDDTIMTCSTDNSLKIWSVEDG
jgi:WD repeat-containing protein 1 (actin-interacting protein 1)